MDDSSSVRATPKALTRLLLGLAHADTHGDDFQPSEGFQVAVTALRCYAGICEKGKGSLSHLMSEVHRVYFPFMGERRSARSRKEGITGSPPGHPYLLGILRDSIVSDNAGYTKALAKHGPRTANGVALAACYAAGVAPSLPAAISDGRQIASLLHRDPLALNLGGLLAAISWYMLREPGLGAWKALQGMRRGTGVEDAAEAVRYGEIDALVPFDDPLPFTRDVARLVGAAWTGSNALPTGLARVVRPISWTAFSLASVGEPPPVPKATVNLVSRLVDALAEKGIVREAA